MRHWKTLIKYYCRSFFAASVEASSVWSRPARNNILYVCWFNSKYSYCVKWLVEYILEESAFFSLKPFCTNSTCIKDLPDSLCFNQQYQVVLHKCTSELSVALLWRNSHSWTGSAESEFVQDMPSHIGCGFVAANRIQVEVWMLDQYYVSNLRMCCWSDC